MTADFTVVLNGQFRASVLIDAEELGCAADRLQRSDLDRLARPDEHTAESSRRWRELDWCVGGWRVGGRRAGGRAAAVSTRGCDHGKGEQDRE
jgi:hypothetical protein